MVMVPHRRGVVFLATVADAGFVEMRLGKVVGVSTAEDDPSFCVVLDAVSEDTLNLLENDFFLPILIGFALFGILTGLAVVVGRILPKWMGWVMFVFGLACLAGPIGFFGILATLLWVLVAGIWMVKQGPPVLEGVTRPAEDRVAA